MKIVIIEKEEPQKISGVDIFNQRFKSFLIKHGHEVFALRFSKKEVKTKNTFHIPYYYMEKRIALLIPSEQSLKTIEKHLKDIRPDLIYANPGMISPVDFFFPSLSKQMHIPLVGTWHMDFNRTVNTTQIVTKSMFLAYLSYCRQLDLLHVFSQKMKDLYTSRGIDPDKILVLPNGVDSTFYSPGKSKFAAENQIKTGVLFLGRLTYQKNPEILLKSFLALNPPRDTKLVMVGYGDQEELLKEKYTDSRIIYTGAILDEQKKLDIMRSCQIFALPSRYEGLSLSLLEAMSVSQACISSNVASNEDVLSDCGIVLTETLTKEQLPLALKLCLDYPDFTKSLGQMSRKKVIAHYNQEKVFARLTDEFQKVFQKYSHE